jgi:hypothetical protein
LTALIIDPAADAIEFACTLASANGIAVEAVSPLVAANPPPP